MRAEVFQIISITAFSLSGIFLVIAVILYFRLNIRGIIDDLSGKMAERQIRALREENRQAEVNKNGRAIYDMPTGKGTAKLPFGRKKGETAQLPAAGRAGQRAGEERTAPLGEEDSTTLLAEEGTVLLAEEGTTLLAEDGTTLLAEDGTELLTEDGTTLPAEDGTELFAEDGTTLLAEEGTTLLTEEKSKLHGSCRWIINEIVIHTEERI